ncbi:MAG: serine hydrolase [Microcoleaceae cyanobacterium]
MAQRSSRSSFLSLISTNRSKAVRQGRSSQDGNSAQPNRRRRRSKAKTPGPVANSPTLPLTPKVDPETQPLAQPTPQPSPTPPQPLKSPKPSVSRSGRRKPKSKTQPLPRRRLSSRDIAPIAQVKRPQTTKPQTTKPQTTQTLSPVSSQAVYRRKGRRTSPMVYGARLLILGIGIGVLSGTVLSVLSSLGRLGGSTQFAESSMVSGDNAVSKSSPSGAARTIPLELQLHQEDKALKNAITNLAGGLSQLNLGLMFVDLNTGAYVDIEGPASFPSASTIKVPILVAFFQAVDTGEIRLDEILTMEDQHIAGGSGDMQYQPSGSQYTALETATKMIAISDNTATNMLIDRLGGPEALNKKFMDWGLKNTVLRNLLPDLPGANKTSPRDLLSVLTQVNQGGLVSMRSRDRMFHIMEQTENNALLPSGIGNDAIIAHKTGTLNSVLADVGLVDMANGKRYLLAVLVGRRDGDSDAEYLIRNVSQLVYQSMQTAELPTENEEDNSDNPDSDMEENLENSELDSTDEFSDTDLEPEEEQGWEEDNWQEDDWENN